MDKKKIMQSVRPVISLLVICLVTSLALAGTNLLTRDRIAELDRQNEIDALSMLIPDSTYDKTDFGYIAKKGSDTIGLIFTTSAKGYSGDVKVMTAIDPEEGTVIAVRVVDVSNETVGLGQRAKEESFSEQYKGKSGEIGVVKGAASEGEITAITGATITSRAVTDAVNQALILFGSVMNGGGEAK